MSRRQLTTSRDQDSAGAAEGGAHVTLFPSNFSRTDYIEFARSPLIVVVVHCMQQANAFDCGMFAAAFVFEWACIPVTLPAAK